MSFLQSHLSKDSVVFDVGANIGPISLALSKICSSGRVYSFEPGDKLFDYLTHNTKSNQISNIEPVQLALTNYEGEISFSYTEKFGGGSFTSNQVREGSVETVECSTLDYFLSANQIERLDLIKIDVEGSELRVLEGSKETIRSLKPDLIVECNFHTLKRIGHATPDDLLEMLKGLYPYVYALLDVPVPIESINDLWKLLLEHNVINLFCSFKRKEIPLRKALKHKYPSLFKLYQKLFFKRVSPPNYLLYTPSYKIESSEVEVKDYDLASLAVSITNTSKKPIYNPSHTHYPINLSYQWLDASKNIVIKDGLRTPLPTKIAPMQTIKVAMALELPEGYQEFILRISLVQELFAWMYELNPSLDHLKTMAPDALKKE